MFDTRDLDSYLPGYDDYLEETHQTFVDVFDEHTDEMYEKYVSDYYKSLEDKNMFVLIYNTSTVREYIVPGTNVHKVEKLDNGKVICTSYFKSVNNRKEEN